MNKTALLLGLHCHQPVDNFHHVVDEAIEKSYRPFFKVASKYKDFKFSVHYSGWLLEYIKENDKELFALMQEVAENGQIEFLSGGFYEPILASIPSRDRIAQIEKLNSFIQVYFNQTPKGLWLTERVWDSVLIKDMAKCGIEYVVVDDYHFISAGFDSEKLNGYFVTEDEGVSMKIFPINKTLRYIVPFEPSKKICDYLKNMADEDISAAVIFDDGEKFGIWPKTYEWVYEQGWLEGFIKRVIQSESIVPMLYKDYIEQSKPISLAYLPIASYIEMGEWSLKGSDALLFQKMRDSITLNDEFSPLDVEKFVKGSVWKNFLIKYYEANNIQKRCLELSNDRLDDEIYLDSLYKAQTNDALWHGVFGGTYLPNLRDNAYRFIIDCENIKYFEKETTEVKDINCDGYDEVKFVSKDLISIFDSKCGANLIELDIRDKSFNLQNTMSRYYEAYHEKIRVAIEEQKETDKSDIEEGIAQEAIDSIHDAKVDDASIYADYLHYDWYTKNSFIDHIVDKDFDLLSFKQCKFNEYGDFVNLPFEILAASDQTAIFERVGGLFIDKTKHKSTLTKTFIALEDAIRADINFKTDQEHDLDYVLEHNIHFANIKDITINGEVFEKDLSLSGVQTLSIFDNYTQKEILFTLDKKADIYLCTVDTLSQSESGFDLTNQAVSIAIKFPLDQNTTISVTMRVK
jgi:hypothetical protein